MWRTKSIGRTLLRLGVLAALVVLFGVLRFVVPTDPGTAPLTRGDGKTLLVLAPPMGGIGSIADLSALVRSSYPTADVIVPTWNNGWLSNADPADLADVLEEAIRKAHDERRYERIVLFGYSLGGVIVRKAFVWGHGEEDDRIGRTRRPLLRHDWVDKVERFVSLAAPNRGWRAELTREADPLTAAASVTFLHATRLTGTGQLVHGILVGSPFIANMRLQWLRVVRRLKDRTPLVVHLVGKRDELVSVEDSLDLAAAPGVLFKTLPALNHREIGHNILVGAERRPSDTALAISKALVSGRDELASGFADPVTRKEDPTIRRVVYVMHGIRDAGYWTDHIKERVRAALGAGGSGVELPDVDYNRIPMAPFLLYWDRQRHVRAFMDQYTDDVARYPELAAVDYFGHSNGTYIAASALQRYRTLRLRNVLFAGSVVPSHFNWTDYTRAGQVVAVRNIVADADWVVALFPQLFELVSRTVFVDTEPRPGPFDIGAAGFRGFVKASKGGPVQDLLFLAGDHGTAVDVAGSDPTSVAKLDAIAQFLARGDDDALKVFVTSKQPNRALEIASNIAWLAWLLLLGAIVVGGRLAARQGRLWLAGYGALVLAVLWTV